MPNRTIEGLKYAQSRTHTALAELRNASGTPWAGLRRQILGSDTKRLINAQAGVAVATELQQAELTRYEAAALSTNFNSSTKGFDIKGTLPAGTRIPGEIIDGKQEPDTTLDQATSVILQSFDRTVDGQRKTQYVGVLHIGEPNRQVLTTDQAEHLYNRYYPAVPGMSQRVK